MKTSIFFLSLTLSLYASNRASAQLSDNPSKEEIERYVEMLKSYIVIGAAAATDVKEAKMGHTRSVAVAISITEEAKSKGFSCYLSTWHMSGRMIRYKWSVDPLKMGMGFEVVGLSQRS